jgi:hypothetical protein
MFVKRSVLPKLCKLKMLNMLNVNKILLLSLLFFY